jgi:hypothetical protein
MDKWGQTRFLREVCRWRMGSGGRKTESDPIYQDAGKAVVQGLRRLSWQTPGLVGAMQPRGGRVQSWCKWEKLRILECSL